MSLLESLSPASLSAASDSQPGGSAGGGKVVHDARGNAFWDWAVATGVLAGTKSAELLRMLDNPLLGIEDEYDFTGEWGGDPYNRR